MFLVFILLDAATLPSNYQHPQLNVGAWALRQVAGFLGFGSLQYIRVKAWDSPSADAGVECREMMEGSREWEEAEKERFTGHLLWSLFNHTTGRPTGGRQEGSRINAPHPAPVIPTGQLWEVPLGRGHLFWNKPLYGFRGTLRAATTPVHGFSHKHFMGGSRNGPTLTVCCPHPPSQFPSESQPDTHYWTVTSTSPRLQLQLLGLCPSRFYDFESVTCACRGKQLDPRRGVMDFKTHFGIWLANANFHLSHSFSSAWKWRTPSQSRRTPSRAFGVWIPSSCLIMFSGQRAEDGTPVVEFTDITGS